LGCSHTTAQASQVEVNKQTAAQNAAAIDTAMLFTKISTTASKSIAVPKIKIITIPNRTPTANHESRCRAQNGAVGHGNAVLRKT